MGTRQHTSEGGNGGKDRGGPGPAPPGGGGARATSDPSIDEKALLACLMAVKNGDFRARMPVDGVGLPGKIYDTLNDIIDANERLALELERVATTVGKEGRISHRASMPHATGRWASAIESVNTL